MSNTSMISAKFITELEEFFVNYHELTGKKYKVIDLRGPGGSSPAYKRLC